MDDDISHDDNFLALTIGQTHDLAASVRDSFGDHLSRTEFIEHLLMFLEDVPGFEDGEVTMPLIEAAWESYRAPASADGRQ